MDLDIDHLRSWIGRQEEASDFISERLVGGFQATLGGDTLELGDPAPLAIHWCLAPPLPKQDELGPDGHAARGGFLPPVPLPRRMWAGGELRFVSPLLVGDRVTRRSRIGDVQVKSGRSGTLCFVAVEHEISTARGIALTERHDIVYRDIQPASAAQPAAASEARPEPEAKREVMADPVLLFRYSALTFNGHRIHYDRDYVTKVEGYPGLIVHGPLQATLMLHLAADMQGGRTPEKFSYRGVSPLFDGAAFTVNGRGESGKLDLWVADASGKPTMVAEAQ
jgi:3-methylfumaryl-CoA hydratase